MCLSIADVRAQPAEQVLELDLAAGPLSATLIEISRLAGRIVSFAPDIVAPYQAPPLRGRFTLAQALTQATQSSGLVAQLTAAGTVTITMPATVAAPSPTPASAEPAAVAAAAGSSSPVVQLPRVEILGQPRQSDGLRAFRSWSATRMDVPIEDLPQHVSVLTGDALALQGNSNSIESLRYVSGVLLTRGIVYSSQGTGGDDANILSGIRVRGLNASVTLSGLRTVRNMVPIDNAFIERIDVVKGPTGVLSGISDYGGRGGQVNLVRKQAGLGARTEVSQSISTQDSGTLRLGTDLSGNLGSDSRTHWRLVGFGRRSGKTEGGYAHQFSNGVLGSLLHRRGDFSAGLTLQVDRQRVTPDPAIRGGIEQADGSFTPVQPGLQVPLNPADHALISTADMELDMAWRLGKAWRFTGKARVEGISQKTLRTLPGTPTLPMQIEERSAQPRDANIQGGLEYTFNTGPVRHQTAVGLDLERWRLSQRYFYDDEPESNVTVINREYRQALTVQDLASIGRWRVRLSVQRSSIPQRERVGYRDRVSQPVRASNWDAGLLYHWLPVASVYAGSQYSVETENRRAGLMLADGSEPPLTGLRQSQVGIKSQLLDGRLAMTLEAFRLRQTNLLVGSVGGLTSRSGVFVDGVEFELNGRPVPALDLHMGLALTRGTIQGGVQRTLPGFPERSLRLLASYRLPESVMSESSLGLAALANSSMRLYSLTGPPGSPFLTLPGGARVDLSLERRSGPWLFTTFLGNVFDRPFYGTVADQRSIPLMPGRSLTVSATFRD